MTKAFPAGSRNGAKLEGRCGCANAKDSFAGVKIESLTVLPDRVACEIRVGLRQRNTSPVLVKRICEIHPTLPLHACVNEVGDVFGAVIEETSLAHLLEHLVIDLQIRATSERDRVYVGTTEWIDERAGLARVEVSFTDDLVALRAFCDASRIINEALVK